MKIENVKYADVSLQEEVPELVLRTDDDFDSDDDIEWETDESEDEEDVEFDRGEEFEKDIGNPGWAEAMAKILNTKTPTGEKSVVLAKAKKVTDVKLKKDDTDFDIIGEAKEEKPDPEVIKKNAGIEKTRTLKDRREWTNRGRVKPCIMEKNRERILAKTATKGIVQLFNSVRQHQISLNKKLSEAGTIRKREKVISTVNKRSFLELLSGSKTNGPDTDSTSKMDTDVKNEDDKSWKVLRDDFMLGANMKDWDKEPEDKLPMEIDSAVKDEEGGDCV